MPGISTIDPNHHQPVHPTIEHVDPSSSYEDFQDGQMSPAESEHSNMTSISQRGVNPNWRPDSGHRPGQPNLGVPGRRPSQPLHSNSNYEIPPGIPAIQHGQAF